jgi:hypothetical protein
MEVLLETPEFDKPVDALDWAWKKLKLKEIKDGQ